MPQKLQVMMESCGSFKRRPDNSVDRALIMKAQIVGSHSRGGRFYLDVALVETGGA